MLGCLKKQTELFERYGPTVLEMEAWGPSLRLDTSFRLMWKFDDELTRITGVSHDDDAQNRPLGALDFLKRKLRSLSTAPAPLSRSPLLLNHLTFNPHFIIHSFSLTASASDVLRLQRLPPPCADLHSPFPPTVQPRTPLYQYLLFIYF